MPDTPEHRLEEASPLEGEAVFKVFLGYAPGVGKTYNMLSEAIRRHSRGEDVVVGVVESHGRKPIMELARQLDTVPRRALEYKGAVFEEMDVDAIVKRKPKVALIDELAHTNIHGSKHGKRYEDVMDILAAGIDVLSTLNVQHIESLTPTVLKITGVQVRETVPDWVLHRVNEIVLADLTPEALKNRMARGDIYPVERAERALGHFFRTGNLIALRELALRQVAHVVDRGSESFLKQKDEQAVPAQERIAVAISSNPSAQYLIARALRLANAVGGEFYCVYVDTGVDDSAINRRSLMQNIEFAENLGARMVKLRSNNVAQAVASFVREYRITHIIFGHSAVSRWRSYLYKSPIHQFLRDAPAIDIHIVKQEAR